MEHNSQFDRNNYTNVKRDPRSSSGKNAHLRINTKVQAKSFMDSIEEKDHRHNTNQNYYKNKDLAYMQIKHSPHNSARIKNYSAPKDSDSKKTSSRTKFNIRDSPLGLKVKQSISNPRDYYDKSILSNKKTAEKL